MNKFNRDILRKVPEITLSFWLIKLITTAMGESTSDYLVSHYNPYMVVVAGFVFFAAAMVWQLAVRRYIAWIYWLAVLMVAIFGTMAADVIHVALGVPYAVSTVVFAVALALIFWLWHRTEGNLSIHSVTTSRRELFYWATVLATFAFGTAAGDLTAYTAHLGFLSAGVLFTIIFAIPAIGYKLLDWQEVLTFWWAYIVTRPIGASFADWTGKEPSVGGLGIGDGPVIVALLVAMVFLVGYQAMNDRQKNKTLVNAVAKDL